ncbi:MAG: clostripain-related cysteine peptidase [Planctomycetota bacterium]|jgi:hypothetical protein
MRNEENRKNWKGTGALVLAVLLLTMGTALADGGRPESIRILVDSPVSELTIDSLQQAGPKPTKFRGQATALLEDGNTASLVLKAKRKDRGGQVTWKLKLKSPRGASPKIKAILLMTGLDTLTLAKGKLIHRMPGLPKTKLALYSSMVEITSSPIEDEDEDPIPPGDDDDDDIPPGDDDDDDEPTPAEWTFMVYLGADNNLSNAGVIDVHEMESVGSSSSVNIVVQAEFSWAHDGGWLPNDYNGDTLRFRVERGQSSLQNAISIGNVNMASPETLTDFVAWSARTYPAKRYALVIWDHGAGWRQTSIARGAVDDETSGDFMNLPDLAKGVRDSGVHLDLVDFDACLMAMYEVAVEFEDVCDILVASEANEPGAGNPFDTILADLRGRPTMTPRELATVIVERFDESYLTYSGPTTKSAVDLSALPALKQAVESLGSSIVANIHSIGAAVRSAQGAAQAYDFPTNLDLFDLCDQLTTRLASGPTKTAAERVKTAVEDAVIANRHQGAEVSRSHGVAIYAPRADLVNDPSLTLDAYRELASSQGGGWLSAVELALDETPPPPPSDDLVPGGFIFMIVWNTDADVDLRVLEPDGYAYFGESPNGEFEVDLDGPQEYYYANEMIRPGRYAPVIELYDGGSAGYADVTLYMYLPWQSGAGLRKVGTERLNAGNTQWSPLELNRGDGDASLEIGDRKVKVKAHEKPVASDR